MTTPTPTGSTTTYLICAGSEAGRGGGTVLHDTSYTYDLAQNRTMMTNNLTQSTTSYTYNAMNQMLTAGRRRPTHGATRTN